MASIRQQRIAEQIHEEISALLMRGLKDPRIGFVTITGVKVTPDLSRAWVYFSTTGGEAVAEQSLEGLNSAASYVRKVLGKLLHLKHIPEFIFKYDTSLDRGDRIERILSDVREQEGWDDPARIRGSADEVAQALRKHQRFLVTAHLNPDGDAVASVLGLGRILESLDKEVVLYNPDPVPHNYAFLPGADQIKTTHGDEPFDATVVMDCSELSRTGPLPAEAMRGELIGIDHHLTTKPLGAVNYQNPGASSIGEMLYEIMGQLGLKLDFELAQCIYTSILSDTGSFRYSNTSPAAMRVAADALALGVSSWDVALEVYESQPLARVRLLAKVLPTLEVDSSGRYGSILVTREMFAETGATKDLIDGFINHPRGIVGVEVAIQFREENERLYKVSFRSRGRINVAQIADKFGGGGHANAAGCSVTGNLEEAKLQIFSAVEEALQA